MIMESKLESERTVQNICPNCGIVMGKIMINEEHRWAFDGPLISVLGVRFQYRCPRCEYLSVKYSE